MKNPNTSDEKKEEIRAKLQQLVRIQARLYFMGLLITPCRVNPSQSRVNLLLQRLKNHEGQSCPFIHALALSKISDLVREFGMFAWMSEFLGRSICYFTSLLVAMGWEWSNAKRFRTFPTCLKVPGWLAHRSVYFRFLSTAVAVYCSRLAHCTWLCQAVKLRCRAPGHFCLNRTTFPEARRLSRPSSSLGRQPGCRLNHR